MGDTLQGLQAGEEIKTSPDAVSKAVLISILTDWPQSASSLEPRGVSGVAPCVHHTLRTGHNKMEEERSSGQHCRVCPL